MLDATGDFFFHRPRSCDTQTLLDVANECARVGLIEEALIALKDAQPESHSGCAPLVDYYRAYLFDKVARTEEAAEARRAAALAPPDYCFPHRLEEIAILQDAIDKNPHDPRAPYYLGNLLYDKRRHEEAITLWEKAARLDGTFPTVWRNLGLAYYNILHDKPAAKDAYQKAFTNSLTWGLPDSPESPASPPGDARILYERDQLAKRTGETPEARLAELQKYPQLAGQRDDLTIEYCTLLNQLRRHDEALAILQTRQFQPWEGGEGLALAQWARTHLALGRAALRAANPHDSLGHFHAALNPPPNLGETWHYLQNNSELHYRAGQACQAIPDTQQAQHHFQIAAQCVGDFQSMAVQTYSENTFFAALALRELGQPAEARTLFEAMLTYAQALKTTPAKIDYFATSLPAMLLFDDGDEGLRHLLDHQSTLIEALARHGLNGQNGADRTDPRFALDWT